MWHRRGATDCQRRDVHSNPDRSADSVDVTIQHTDGLCPIAAASRDHHLSDPRV
jgi:hypothetical protein